MKSGIDFYFNKEYVYLTAEGKEKFGEGFIPPEKIKHFVTEKTSFQVWKKIFLEKTKETEFNSTTEKENCIRVKQIIRRYIREQLNLNFIGYCPWEKNIFSKTYPFGGIPDGIYFDSEGLISSVLGIKFLSTSSKWVEEWTVYFIQLFFYMWLSGVNEAYVCVVRETEDIKTAGSGFLKLSSPLVSVSEGKTYVSEKRFAALNKTVKFKYKISERYKSQSSENSVLSFFKVTVDMEEYLPLVEEISKWLSRHKYKSPKMSAEEYLEIWNLSNGVK